MNRTQAEHLITEQLKPIFGFALRRCGSIQDAEDAAQEITLRAYQTLLNRDDVTDPVRYIWVIAHNVVANCYRDRSRTRIGIPDSEPDRTDFQSVFEHQEGVSRLRLEVARLSRVQREIIVAYYFHGQKQTEIAAATGLPLGTVKWHLFEAKKELKRNMENQRDLTHLQFDPIRFSGFGTEGSIGDEGSPWRIFRSVLNQNIVYAVRRDALSITEIADALGVSPVYVEDSVASLFEQGYLCKTAGRYHSSILLTEVTSELTALSDHMYQEAAKRIAPDLCRALQHSDFWSEIGFHASSKPTPDRFSANHEDKNFALWALIPWCIAHSQPQKEIAFSKAATLRPDGARNLCYASVNLPGTCKPCLYYEMDSGFSGPCWNEHDGVTLWQLDTCWSERRIGEIYQQEVQHTLSSLKQIFEGTHLMKEEYARLAQKGLLQISGDPDAPFTAVIAPVWLEGPSIRNTLLRIVQDVYAAHQDALDTLHKPYAHLLLQQTPPHLYTLRRYLLQNTFQSDWFIQHCLHTLVQTGLLSLPNARDQRALHTIILTA